MVWHKIISTACCLALLAAAARSSGLALGIAQPGSPHNFSDNIGVQELGATGWNKREEICRVCHVPHDHNRAEHYGDVGLLWNHSVTSATYSMYASATLDGAIASQPTGTSKMCLGCHDGTVGVDTFDKYAGGVVFIDDYNVSFQVPGALYQTGGVLDLTATHPLSVIYDESADVNLQPRSNAMGASGTIADVLENGDTLQCSSCHDVHDQPGESAPGTHLLRVGQAASLGTASALCLTCHIK